MRNDERNSFNAKGRRQTLSRSSGSDFESFPVMKFIVEATERLVGMPKRIRGKVCEFSDFNRSDCANPVRWISRDEAESLEEVGEKLERRCG